MFNRIETLYSKDDGGQGESSNNPDEQDPRESGHTDSIPNFDSPLYFPQIVSKPLEFTAPISLEDLLRKYGIDTDESRRVDDQSTQGQRAAEDTGVPSTSELPEINIEIILERIRAERAQEKQLKKIPLDKNKLDSGKELGGLANKYPDLNINYNNSDNFDLIGKGLRTSSDGIGDLNDKGEGELGILKGLTNLQYKALLDRYFNEQANPETPTDDDAGRKPDGE